MRILGGEKRHFLISSFSSSVARAVTLKKIRVSSRCFLTAFLNKKRVLMEDQKISRSHKKKKHSTQKKGFFVRCLRAIERESARSFTCVWALKNHHEGGFRPLCEILPRAFHPFSSSLLLF